MKINTKRAKAKKETPEEDPIFLVDNLKARLPKSILDKLQEMTKRAKGKRIPVLLIDDPEAKIKATLKPNTRLEERIKKLQNFDIVSLALQHLLNCRGQYL